jgi:transcription elongation factor Elf1
MSKCEHPEHDAHMQRYGKCPYCGSISVWAGKSERTNRSTCPYCGYDFGTEAALDQHVPCPERDRGD